MKTLLLVIALAAPLGVPRGAHAQGCSQCREALGQTPARTQAAYRRGIVVLILAAGVVFTGTLALLKNYR